MHRSSYFFGSALKDFFESNYPTKNVFEDSNLKNSKSYFVQPYTVHMRSKLLYVTKYNMHSLDLRVCNSSQWFLQNNLLI